MNRIVTQSGKRDEALKKTRKIRISVTAREILIGGRGTPPVEQSVIVGDRSTVCPYCHLDIVAAVNQALDRMESTAAQPEVPAADHIDPHRNTQSNKY